MAVKIAFLLGVHMDVPQAKRLCERLLEVGDVFIHVDKKAEKVYADMRGYVDENAHDGRLRLCSEFKVYWGEWSQVQWMHLLLEQAFSSDTVYDRFVYLTGTDYPLMSTGALMEYFEAAGDREFVNGEKVSEMKLWTRHYYTDRFFHNYIHFKNPRLQKTLLKASLKAGIILKIPRKTYFTLADGRRMDLYRGGQFSGITRACAEHVLEVMKDPALVRYYRHCMLPDESFMQTIVFNSPFAEKATLLSAPTMQSMTPLHCIEEEYPVISYDETAFDRLLASGKPFFRKCVSGKSDKLVAKIDSIAK